MEIEVYELNTDIAANCGLTVNLGPGVLGDPDKQLCSDYKGAFDVVTFNLSAQAEGITPFYADGAANCDCYYTSGGHGYFTS